MKALIYQGPGKLAIEEKPKPIIEHPADCILRMVRTTICGTDLHIKKGDVETVTSGRTLGHEGVGIIESVGSGVYRFKPGDRVLISCITSCRICNYCREKVYSHCTSGGWMLGNTIDGTQAEFVRIPYADTSLYHVPENLQADEMVMFSDVLPTAFETGVLKGCVQFGDIVAIVGAGPIGLATLLTAQLFSPAAIIMIDVDAYRLEVARQFGANFVINAKKENPVEKVLQVTQNLGVDVAIEAAGLPETFYTCQSILKPGGHLANIGVHGTPVTLHLEKLWHHNVTITATLVDTYSIAKLIESFKAGKLATHKLITHHFEMGNIIQAYDAFSKAAENKVLKVIIEF